MTDLSALVAQFKTTLDKQPKDHNSRPFHEALLAVLTAMAARLEADGDPVAPVAKERTWLRR